MIVLGIDSSSVSGAAAVADGERILGEELIHNGLTHSQTLLPLVEKTLRKAGVTIGDVALFAVTAGPGSFTGLRIGLAAVKGMAAVREVPCVAFSTLEALAFGVPENGIVCSVLDARRSQFYTALFRREEGRLYRIAEDAALSEEELAARLFPFSEPVRLVGDGALLCYSRLAGRCSCLVPPEENDRFVKGSAVALLGAERAGEACAPGELRPEYLRLPQAERELKEREAQAAGTTNIPLA